MKNNNWRVHQENVRLLSFLSDKFQSLYSLRFMKRVVESNHCVVNGKVERFASRKLQKGDLVTLHDFSSMKTPKKPRILFEDDSLVCIDKPIQTISEPKEIEKYFPNHYLTHRLDKDTTGVLILAKSSFMKKRLEALFKERKIHKKYLAIVEGKVKNDQGKIQSFLSCRRRVNGLPIWGSSKKGAFALTLWKCFQKNEKASLLQVMPKTGRTHQIRVHFFESGHPLLGDYQYHRNFRCSIHVKRPLLHAESVSFIHPFNHENIKIKAPLPKDFQTVQRSLGLDP